MELSGTVLRQVTTHPYSLSRSHHGGARVVPVGPRRRVMIGSSGFCDEGHIKYYSPIRSGCKDKGNSVITVKKKLKLLKGLSKDLSMFSQLGFDLDPQKRALLDDLQGNLNSDAAEMLMKQLEQARAEEKEMKKKMKQEKKIKLKAAKKMKTVPDCESSSSSSESSDSECDKVVDMDMLRARVAVAPVNELQPTMLYPQLSLPHTTVVETPQQNATSHYNQRAIELCSRNDTCVSSTGARFKNESTDVFTTASQKRIEVCMGNKCKKLGAAALLQQFEKVVGIESGAVVGCKCLGKCKTAPNVRVQNAVDDGLAKGLNDSVQIPANPLCIGVGLKDVDTIVARFFGENQEGMDIAAAST
ncbi:hypothetical protein Lal_00040678 [Lupinus albus]|uniref:Putative diacylglycerol O-acyltransferase n=1 Tax=Lupinus albus TaxID=3870 RepID=A0A6A4PJC2_LUPAL|nr:putative diacylglycerol O-acyltransferase [Lupinus albus]KAF1887624.1 hypothetical protein Lal_00040678 [Lupinus albus]